ncbi:MAG: quinolinate synthase NadA [Bacillota bacterium]
MKDELIAKIKRLKEEKNAVVLAHNYQEDQIQDIADYTGDSLGLSRKAANLEEEVIVFCGVDFMAESAAILSPEKKVLLPERNAGCPMAEMISIEDLRIIKEDYPEAVVICYVNSSAAVKAESDICCTSSNAVEIVKKVDSEQIIFVPDKNLGDYVQQYTDKEIIKDIGYCPTHCRAKLTDINQVRKIYPNAVIAVHPECNPEVVEAADFVGSTAQIIDFAQETANQKIVVGTEMGILYKLQEDNPDKTFYILNQGLICHNMKMTTVEDVYLALKEMQYQITVPEEIRNQAQRALDKMLEYSS